MLEKHQAELFYHLRAKRSSFIGASLSEPHTTGTSNRLRTITIKHGKLVYSSIDNLNYTENSRNGLLTIYLTEMAH